MRRSVLLLLGALALAACGTPAGAGGGTADVDGAWHLTGGTADGAGLPAPPGTQATLELAGDEARGTAFCNSWFATARLDGSALSLTEIGRTEMGCPPELMAAESAYLTALAAIDTAALDGEELVLTGDGVELRFGPLPAVPPSPLEGTRWVLESLIDGPTASSVLGEAVLELASDGTATGSTSCSRWSGTWQRDGGTLRTARRELTDQPCASGLGAEDVHVTAVLEAGPAIEFREDRLTLTAADGRGLVYRAG
ncbi:hypothetical protein DQ239_03395 [Blastococcus sp. TF02-09]|uniref:META domain-containing protein n=1 Tax=Blastococcus sp. TF02-09 TaxID=2250576 RepID=UPI000DEA981B|nr:META domain-containing protein [Blastococcus sp. TF02-9]RBY80144.1 hypothetical protein DQ239_03395 [Blastococcus sp. TF02-9]